MGVAEVGGPVPNAQRGMEEIDLKLRSILLIFVIYCSRVTCSALSRFLGGTGRWGHYKWVLQSLYRFCTLSLDAFETYSL